MQAVGASGTIALVNRPWLSATLLFAWCGTASLFAQAPAAPPPAATAPAPSYPNVRVGATLFTDYTYTASPESTDADGNKYSPSSFNLARSFNFDKFFPKKTSVATAPADASNLVLNK